MDSQRRNLRSHKLTLLAVCLLLAGSAQAGGPGWFAGVHVGPTKLKGYELEGQTDKLDDSDKGWAIDGGYS